MKFLVLFLAALVSAHAATAQKELRPDLLTDAYVPLVIIGEGWSQQIIIQNVDDEDNLTGTLKFFTAEGEPWRVDLVGHGTVDQLFVTLRPNQLVIYETATKAHAQELGYAFLDVGCCPYSMVQTIFRRQEAGRPDLMTSLPVGDSGFRSSRIFFDNRDGKFAGVGILTTGTCFSSSCETGMRLRFLDENGNVFHEDTRTQRNKTLHWFSLSTDYPQAAGRIGTLEISSADPEREFISVMGFSLQFAPNGAFTAVTTVEN
jgi:hypothetical protein